MYISTSLCKLLRVCIFRASSYHPSWKKLEKNGSSPRRSHVKWPDLATLATSHAMAFQRPRVPVFQSHRSVSSVSWMISGIVEQVIIGIWWGKMGCCSGCVSFRSLGAAILEIPLFEAPILALADRNVWQGVAASVSQCHKGRVATGQVLLYPFCSGLQGWHMKLRTKTCCLICDFLVLPAVAAAVSIKSCRAAVWREENRFSGYNPVIVSHYQPGFFLNLVIELDCWDRKIGIQPQKMVSCNLHIHTYSASIDIGSGGGGDHIYVSKCNLQNKIHKFKDT